MKIMLARHFSIRLSRYTAENLILAAYITRRYQPMVIIRFSLFFRYLPSGPKQRCRRLSFQFKELELCMSACLNSLEAIPMLMHTYILPYVNNIISIIEISKFPNLIWKRTTEYHTV